MFLTRLLSGIVLVILALVIVGKGGALLFVVSAAVSLIGMYELCRVMGTEKSMVGLTSYAAGILYYALLWMNDSNYVTPVSYTHLPGDGASHHVDDAENLLPVLLRLTQRCQRIGGLARLAYHDDQGARQEDGVAVAVFRGQIHLHGDPGDSLEHVLCRHAGVVGGAAGHDLDRCV